MEIKGEDFKTRDQEPNYGSTSNVVLQADASKYGTVVPEHAIQIPDNERQKSVMISKSSEWSTLKVPSPMFKVDKEAYVPNIVSIGPFYHNEPSLQAMQTHKRRFLHRLIRNRTGKPILESLKNAMREMEKDTRCFYANDFQDIESDNFVQMMLLDGCFIVELLRLNERKCDLEEEPIFETRWMLSNISRDLLLLENQLPMAVLRKIFELTTFTGEASLNMIALSFFESSRPGKKELAKLSLHNHVDHGKTDIHLLALFHSSLTSGQPVKSEERKGKTKLELPGKGWVHNAKTLRYAGIKLKTNSGSILDISFNGKMLSIPTMIIDDGTGPMLRNLIAYEQNNRHASPHFCFLAVFLDSIVDTVVDVKILRDARIIQQAKGGDQEVVNLFNSLTKELVFDIDVEHCNLSEQIERINDVCRAHDTRVKIRHFLANLNYKGIPKSIFYSLITVVTYLFYFKYQYGYSSLNNDLYSPPVLASTAASSKTISTKTKYSLKYG